jgi:RNase P subunit RPR2
LERARDLPKITVQSRMAKLRKQYEEDYDLSSLNSSNDASNLESLLRYQIIIEDLQEEINGLMEQGAADNITAIKKLSDAAKDMLDRCMTIERQLGIDRKTRKSELDTDSPAEYISKIKSVAKEFLGQRLQRVMCADCKIQLFKFLPTYEHNRFELKVTCPQCGKTTKVHRNDKSILYDVPAKDKAWREKYPMEVVPPKLDTTDDIDDTEDDVIIGG